MNTLSVDAFYEDVVPLVMKHDKREDQFISVTSSHGTQIFVVGKRSTSG